MRKPFTDNYPLTQGFGLNPADYAKFGLKGHDGQDYGLPTGTLVLAPHDGIVVERAFDGPGYGNYLKIESSVEGSVLGHLQTFLVEKGATVKEGDPVAYSDNTGNSSGPHLHWGYYRIPRDRSNGFAGFIDQTPYINSSPKPTMSDIEKKKLVQFDRTVNALHDAGLIPTAASEQFFDNPADEDKFTNFIKRLIQQGH
jgi:murein DD-endopeptidase MepM/ murein hydrolase activator NlpD